MAASLLQRHGRLYAPHVAETFEQYQSRLDPRLGWPSPRAFGRHDFDMSGSRIIPAFPDPYRDRACVSLYGDSFTWGDEVDNEHAWSNVLSRKLHCRVANYGVGGYGTDQAYLRFYYQERDPAQVVILGFSSENIRRHVNRFRNLIIPTPQFALKPRFKVDAQGDLKLVPLPALTQPGFREMNASPERCLTDDFFLPGGPSGVRQKAFPYTLCVARQLGPVIRQAWSGLPPYAEFYDPGHPSGALQVTRTIFRAFQREARARGQSPLVVIVPLAPDLRHYRKTGRWVYQPLLDALQKDGGVFLNLGEGLLTFLGNRNPGELFSAEGHYNHEGYEALGAIVFQYLHAGG